MKEKIKPMIYQTERKMELLHTDKYKNYKYYILNLGTHPTAYIAIPKGHKLYEKDYNDICDINVHGGLTYSDNKLMGISSDNWFIGWDYAHAYDYMGYYTEGEFLTEETKKWTTEEIIKECENAIDQIIEFESEEILEEEKKIPEKLSTWFSLEQDCENDNIQYANNNFKTMYEKINEICDYLKSKGE